MPFAKLSNKGGSSRWGRSSSVSNKDPYSAESLERQIENAKLRIQDAGFDSEEDKRNWFEKATNLPEGQNWFFDALDIIGRPGQAVLNPIEKVGVNPLDILKGNASAPSVSDILSHAYKGFTGKEKAYGSDIAEKHLGIDNKVGQFATGLLIDIGTDPTNLIPAGTIAKVGRGFGNAVKSGYNAIENAAPTIKTAREATQEVVEPVAQAIKDVAGNIFKYQYKWDDTLTGGKDDTLKRLYNQSDNAIKFGKEESLKNVADIAKVTGIEAGNDIGRVMENDLQINKSAQQLLGDILKGQSPKINLADGEVADFIGKVNQRILTSPEVKQQVAKKTEQLTNVNAKITELNNQFDLKKIMDDLDNGYSILEVEEKALSKLSKYNQAKNVLEKDIANINRGIKFNPLQTTSQMTKGEGFEIVNPKQRLYKKAVGNVEKFIKEISPKESFDKIVSPELRDTLRPIAEKIIQDGKIATQNIKGTPIESELKRIFGKDIAIHSKKNSTITLKNTQNYHHLLSSIHEAKNDIRSIEKVINNQVDSLAKSMKIEKEEAFQNAININKAIRERGGISAPRNGAFAGEYKETVPNHLKRKDGLPLDEMADELGLTAKELLDVLRTPIPKETLDSYKPLAEQMLMNDSEFTGLKETLEALKGASLPNTNVPLDDIKFTNTIDNINLERPERILPESPLIHVAAKRLMESNDDIRQIAQQNGINIDKIQGYMTHILTDEAKKSRPKKVFDSGNSGIGAPNKNVIKKRKYDGSVEDVNELLGVNLFNSNAFFATGVGQKRLIEYIYAESFKRQVLGNLNFAVPFKKGMVVPENTVIINSGDYKFFKVSTPEGNEFLGLAKPKEYIVTKGAKEALDRYQKLTTDEGVNAVLKAFDAAQSVWKRMALFSAPYHLRNAVGAMFNNWVGGMNTLELGRYTSKATKEVVDAIKGRESKLFTEYRKQGLSASSLSQVEFRPYGEPEKAIEKTIKERSKDVKGQVLTRLNPLRAFETSREIGDVIDQTNRFALYMWARKKGMSPEKAAEKVREVQFDYTRTTGAEREIFTRAMPFYRWMRNNLPFQVRQFINDPRKYNNMDKIRENAQDVVGIDDENVPDWMKSSFAIPVSGDGKGSGQFISMNLPLGDLTKLDSPGKTLVDSTSPLLKLIPEYVLNRNFFYDKPIQKFEGHEKQFQIPGTDVQFGIDAKNAYALEQATGQIGRGLSGYLQRPEEEDLDTKFRMPSLGISSVVKPFDVEKANIYQLLDELKKYRDQIDYIEQQTGIRPRMVNEIR